MSQNRNHLELEKMMRIALIKIDLYRDTYILLIINPIFWCN